MIYTKPKVVDTYTACAYIEGFNEGEGATVKEQVEAWAYLIRTGKAWQLQGFYGRGAKNMIDEGFISDTGVVDWELVELVLSF